MKLSEKQKEKIEEIAQKYQLRLVLLFGSRASNKFVRKDSDFDIAFLSQKNLSFDQENYLNYELTNIFQNNKVDTVDIRKAPPLLMKQIFDNNIILYCKNKIIYHKYMIYAERRYAEAKPLFELQSISIKNFLKKHAK